jgi:uncharacterized caspase-like protein
MAFADRALVVGINRYPGISALSGAENDADEFYKWVTDPAGGAVDKTHALLLRSSDFEVPANPDKDRPAKEQIEEFFTDIDNSAEANNAAPGGLGLRAGKRLWLFFSGHGFAPSLDRSGVLMANATLKRVHNVAAMLWANRLHEGGWFDDVLLFQDACRSRIKDADLTPPFLAPRQASSTQNRRRFYAFSAKNKKLSKELTINGVVRGVFTVTLLQGLRGAAKDRETGAITTRELKYYLEQNMQNLLPEADRNNDEIAKMPEVFDPDPFEILPAPAVPQVSDYPVRIAGTGAGPGAHVFNASFQSVVSANPAPDPWPVRLPIGFYKVVTQDGRSKVFEVTGAHSAAGIASEVDVRI